jgi:hypothetical protein
MVELTVLDRSVLRLLNGPSDADPDAEENLPQLTASYIRYTTRSSTGDVQSSLDSLVAYGFVSEDDSVPPLFSLTIEGVTFLEIASMAQRRPVIRIARMNALVASILLGLEEGAALDRPSIHARLREMCDVQYGTVVSTTDRLRKGGLCERTGGQYERSKWFIADGKREEAKGLIDDYWYMERAKQTILRLLCPSDADQEVAWLPVGDIASVLQMRSNATTTIINNMSGVNGLLVKTVENGRCIYSIRTDRLREARNFIAWVDNYAPTAEVEP